MSPNRMTDRAQESEQQVVIIWIAGEGHIADPTCHIKTITLHWVWIIIRAVHFNEEKCSFAAQCFLIFLLFAYQCFEISRIIISWHIQYALLSVMWLLSNFLGREKNLKTISFYQKIPHMGTHMLRALMLEKKKKKLKNMGTNMLLSWKTHFFEPSAHF